MRKCYLFFSLFCLLPFIARTAPQEKMFPFSPGETIHYNIYYKKVKIGTATLKFVGERKLEGKGVYYITFYTHTPYFKDLEKIYADKETFLPLRVERRVSRLAMPVMRIKESYDQRKKEIVIVKKGLLLTKRMVLKKEDNIDNPILSVYHYRLLNDMAVGDELVLNFPRRRFRVKYEGVKNIRIRNSEEKVKVFRGYPAGFQVMLREGRGKIPLKIENPSLFGYSLVFTKVDYADN